MREAHRPDLLADHALVEEIWRATLRVERRRRVETSVIAVAGLASAICLVATLFAIYSAFAGLW